ncbi:unnamed protein product [Miscanthus lutarioriparius]|uniref:Pentatricopeptide repeat-containing protein n=1 Tax=Miscanthus lutarioriparius TaxID=422564 RepID=A0A811PB82_9POAL|nr:unnamed protein product [Miscanthus lutarioriparius]
MKPPRLLPLLRRHLSSAADAAELASALSVVPSPDAKRDLAILLRRLGGCGLASALSSLPAPLPVSSALRLLQHILSDAHASASRHAEDLLSPRVSALLLPSLVADRASLPSARRLVSRLLSFNPLSVAAAAIADSDCTASADLLVRACLNSPAPGSLSRAADAFLELSTRGASPSIKTCNILVEALGCGGQLDVARKVFGEMRDGKTVAPDVHTYTVMIKALCRAGEIDAAFAMLAELRRSGIQPTVVTYNVLMDALCKSGRVEEAFRLKGEWLKAGKGHCSEVLKLFDEMASKGIKQTVVTYNLIAKALCKEGEMERAEQILDEMLLAGMMVHCSLFNSVVAWHLRGTGRLDLALRLIREMLARFLKPNDALMTACIQELCKRGNTKKQLKFGSKYWVKVEEILHLLDQMKSEGLKPDIVTYGTIIDGYCKAKDMHKANECLTELMKNGLRPNAVIYNALIGGYGRNGNISDAIGVLDTMKDNGIQPTPITYSSLMYWMCHAGLVEEAKAVFAQCIVKNIELGVIAYTIIIQGLCKIGKIDEAVMYFKEMHSRDIPPNRMTYTTLMFAYCKSGNNEEASKLFDEMVSIGIVPDSVSYNTLISGFCEVDSLDKMVESPAEMSSRVLKQDGCLYNAFVNGITTPWCQKEAVSSAE